MKLVIEIDCPGDAPRTLCGDTVAEALGALVSAFRGRDIGECGGPFHDPEGEVMGNWACVE